MKTNSTKSKIAKSALGAVCTAGIGAAAVKLDPEIINKTKKASKNGVIRAYNLVMDKAMPWVDRIFPPTKVVSGIGSVKKVPGLLHYLGVTKVMLVTDPVVGKLIVPPIADDLRNHGIDVEIYDQVEENPTVTTVNAIKKQYLETGCNGLLAVGGGSPMDASKAAGACVVKPHTDVTSLGGMFKVLHKLPPLVAVPTTAGTASEMTMGAVISDHENRHKYAIMDASIEPDYAVLDANLTLTLPPFVTATTGVDALTHAVESYVTWAYNCNESNRAAEEAVVKIFRNLEKAYTDGSDIDAREAMLMASYKAGCAFNRTGVGYVHAIAHAMGGIYNTAHGLANAVILPIVLEDYGAAVHPQLAHLAEITGVKTTGTDAEKANAFIREIRNMNKRMGLPSGFDFLNEKDFGQIIKWALKEGNTTYPVPVIYDEARMRHVLNRIKLEA